MNRGEPDQAPARSIRRRAGVNEKGSSVRKDQECGVAAAGLDLVDVECAGRPGAEGEGCRRLSEAVIGPEQCK